MVEHEAETTEGGSRLCDFIHARQEHILAQWEHRLRLLPVTARLSGPALRDHMPRLLERLSLAVRGVRGEEPGTLDEQPEGQALEPLHEGLDLSTLIRELGALRDTILELWEREAAGAVPVQEVRRLGSAIDEAITAWAERFSRARERTLQALERVSSAALGSGDLDTFLPQLLAVLLETVAAVDSVVVLLRDEQDVLHVRAAVGLEEEVVQGFSVRVGEGFAGTIALRREPLMLRDAASDPLVRSPIIRAAGVHALYGVPLLHGGEVIGVAHMGSRTAYAFSEAASQLFHAMAQRATALMVQARLMERLRRGEARLQAIIDHAPAAIYVKDLEGRYLLVNHHMERIHHRPREAMLGRTDYEVVSAERADAFRANDLQVFRDGVSVTTEEVLPQAGEERTYLSVKFSLPDARGRPSALCGISTDITERKRMESALRESEERFRLLVEGVRDYAIFMLDPEGRVVSWNPGAERIKGYKAEEILGQRLTRFYPPEDVRAGVPELALRVAATEGRFEMEGLRVRKDGSRFWADVVLTALRDETGRLRGFAKVTRDITARKRIEEALRETGQRLKAILDTAVDGIITIDERGIMRTVNPATTRIFGYAPEELVGRKVDMLMPQPYRDQHDGYMDNYLRTGVRKVIGIGREVQGMRKDGGIFPLELSVSETGLAQGRFFTGIVRDISQRKEAENAQALLVEAGTLLAQSLDLPTTLRNLASLAVAHLADFCMVDLLGEDGQLHREVVLAKDPARQEVAHATMAYPPEVGSGSPMARVLETGEPVTVEITPAWLDAAARDAKHREVLEKLAPRSTAIVPLIARGRKLGLINLASAEPGRMTRPSTLEVVKGVADRAAIAIDNARLFQEAQEAIRVREDVVAIVSHDLRNPLSAISMSATTLIKREDLDARTTKAATRIYTAADRAHRLIRDLLDFTQARVGGIPINPEPGDFHALSRQVIEEVRSAHPERHLRFQARGDGHGTWDAGRVAQGMANLLGNAIQHSPAETVVDVTTWADGDTLVFEVRNQGTPIDAELLPTLFEPFRRGQDAAAGMGGSLGLGLFITRRIVEAHGGDIRVRSTAEEGTLFTVRLPRQLRPRGSGG